MKREIYEVYAKVVDANGAYNTLSGYPKVYDSHQAEAVSVTATYENVPEPEPEPEPESEGE